MQIALNRLQKGYSMKAERRPALPYLISAGHVHIEKIKIFTLCVSTNEQENHQGVLIQGLQGHFSKQANTQCVNMEPANSEVQGRWTYIDIDVDTGYSDISKQL